MQVAEKAEKLLSNYIGGQWVEAAGSGVTPVYNPSRGSVIAQTPLCGNAEVDRAVQVAKEAAIEWGATPPNERAQVFFRLKILLEENFEELARGISLEHGKTWSEGRGDLRRGIEVVEFACGAPSLLMGESLENIASKIDCHTDRQPLGVVAGIAPFNFPALVPMWMWPVSIVCGNTFILKPSEKVPLTMTRIVELCEQAGMPPGVLNIVHGGKDCVNALLDHPDIAAISFVGSTPIAKYIYERGTQSGKRVQAAGGAKNFVVVMPDADVDRAVPGLRDAAFGCAGERCMAGSTTIVVGEAKDRFLPSLVDAVKTIRVGPTDVEDQPDMGAVISAEHRDRVSQLISKGESEGARILTDGRSVQVDEAPGGFYVGPTIIDGVEYGSTLSETEVFGPVLNVMHAKNLEEAIELANRSAFGNGACIYTSSGKAAREYRNRVQAGMIGINVGVPAPLAYFPFSGWNASFFGDLHIQGKEAIYFNTRQKVTTARWFSSAEGEIWAK